MWGRSYWGINFWGTNYWGKIGAEPAPPAIERICVGVSRLTRWQGWRFR